MRVSDFHFDLPEELIAQSPPPVRGTSRMLLLDKKTGEYSDDFFRNLPEILRPGDLLILNDSRVLPARLYATRARGPHTQHNSPDPTGRLEVLLTQYLVENQWTALVRPSRKIQAGEHLHFFAPDESFPLLEAEVLSAGEFGERTLRFAPTPDFHAILNKIGHMPLPPYIHRSDTPQDRDRYQTVYAQKAESNEPGSAAAPTAGLHFT
ncbi:MAG TPA: S-adenosylmethionine:tRNA ribosyltransferase-isomerase, partial [Edaphobacter sp.]|nr:S-adenosylmethionine:tRNA ribosyltransferase-isomerase [Edaphobacter sp.]